MLYQPPTGGAANDPYVGANPGAGIAGSKVPPKAIEHHQRELIALITGSGYTPAEGTLTQVAQAVRSQRLNFIQTIGGTAGAITATLAPAPLAWSELVGTPLVFITTSTNTATPTINLNGLGAKTIVYRDGAALAAGAWLTGALVTVVYDGTNVRLLEASKSAVLSVINAALNDYIVIADQKAAGTGGGDFLAGAWRTRDLNTVLIDPNGFVAAGTVTLAGNQVTIGAGTWQVTASAPAMAVNSHKTRLQNITDGTTALTGTSEQTSNNTNTDQIMTRSSIIGRIVLAAPKAFEIQHICEQSSTTFNPNVGFGIGNTYIGGTGNETYSLIEIRKIG